SPCIDSRPQRKIPIATVGRTVDAMVHFNEPITFGPSGSARELNPTGISFRDAGPNSWTTAQVVEIEVQLPITSDPITLEMNAAPFLAESGNIASQQVFIYLNGVFQGYCSLEKREKKSIRLTRRPKTDGSSKLTFVIPTAASPKSVGIGPDVRELGLALNSITFVT